MTRYTWHWILLVVTITFETVFILGDNFSSKIRDENKGCFCKLKGEIDDCSCKVETLDSLNNNKIFPRLNSLLSRNYFRYFKVNLKKVCPFWSDDSRCALKDCHVSNCPEDSVPPALVKNQKKPENKYAKKSNEDDSCEEERELGALDRTLSAESKEAFKNWTKYDESQDLFCDLDDESSADLSYVDLLLNPERYTGYKGASTRRIWRTIYEENCFKPQPTYGYEPKSFHSTKYHDMCLEKRVFYRMVSGLHTSINTHLSARYYTPAINGFGQGVWGPNVKEFKRRFEPETTNGEGPQRLKNLYFTYLVELRAIAKAAPYLLQEEFYTGDSEEDEDVKEGIHELLHIINSFSDHFDESQLFKGNSKEALKLKEEFRNHFRNISRIMDCVGCDKCKLWGKLQINGMGTALKILFSGDTIGPQSTVNAKSKKTFQLTRTEIVTLFNAFGRLSNSIHFLEEFRAKLK
ncbi:ERO1-like protein beta isoform X2 [Gigantopelta aegis]|uniref:ERO1-like protein beta isoform X2 n=1 Tax=Gigantopelta aegis TaxID=1735272 RepID=UPI001B88BB05|nr:ERO1-like protein beta isoform X2 [Gigantopelta aegis]